MTWVSGESSDNLRGSPSCTAVLHRHNNTCALIIHQKHVHTRTHTLTQTGTGDTAIASLFLDMKCCHRCWMFLLFKGRNQQCYHDREKNILRASPTPTPSQKAPTSPPPALSQPPHWLLISNSWVTSWEICEWTVQPGSYLALQISAPCRTMRHNNSEAALPASFTT